MKAPCVLINTFLVLESAGILLLHVRERPLVLENYGNLFNSRNQISLKHLCILGFLFSTGLWFIHMNFSFSYF